MDLLFIDKTNAGISCTKENQRSVQSNLSAQSSSKLQRSSNLQAGNACSARMVSLQGAQMPLKGAYQVTEGMDI